MNQQVLLKHKLLNNLQLFGLFLLLSGLVVYIAFMIAGGFFALFAMLMVVMLYISNAYLAPSFILRMYKAQYVPYESAPILYDLVDELSSLAGLSQSPNLYYVPSSVINSFTVGRPNDAAIAISDGILKSLSYEEIAGILGHEISHIKNDDIRVMTFADIAGRIVKILSIMGQIMIIVTLPLTLLLNVEINWLPLIIMIFSPIGADLIQLGMSRIREYEADLGSAMLLGTATPLASALTKIEQFEHRFFYSLLPSIRKIPEPSLLRTHPSNEDRIKRLMEVQEKIEHEPLKHDADVLSGKRPHHHITSKSSKPKRHFNGFWY